MALRSAAVLTVLLAASAHAQESEPLLRALNGDTPGITAEADQRVTVRIACGGASLCDNSPLVVVDGVPVEADSCGRAPTLAALDPDDVVGVRVLQVGEATQLYGAAARSGVISVTTRRALVSLPAGVVVSAPFPNPAPAGAPVTVRVEAEGPVRAEVFDALGRRVRAVVAETGPLVVPTAGLAAGAYVVRVGAGGKAVGRRFVVR